MTFETPNKKCVFPPRQIERRGTFVSSARHENPSLSCDGCAILRDLRRIAHPWDYDDDLSLFGVPRPRREDGRLSFSGREFYRIRYISARTFRLLPKTAVSSSVCSSVRTGSDFRSDRKALVRVEVRSHLSHARTARNCDEPPRSTPTPTTALFPPLLS